jgi:hypothetical protein
MTVFRIRLVYHFKDKCAGSKLPCCHVSYPEYSLDTAIVEFFTQPSATREASRPKILQEGKIARQFNLKQIDEKAIPSFSRI